uniref:Zgc:153759 n=1 Tax=Lepisosteus oculatus TaxID=7918 RepID=W5MF94_LEPOC
MCEACDSQEYAHGEICCPKCNRGERVAKNCTDTTSTLCKTCPESTYMDHPNELNECKRCQKCEAEEGMITKLRCSPTSNSVCECGEGFFCSVPADRGCSKCLNHTVCSEGQFTKQNEYLVNGECCPMCPIGSRVLRHCTEFSNTSCIPCVGPTYTDQPNGLLSCFPCKVCDPGLGLRTLHGCTNQKDTVCWVLSGYYCIDQADGGCRAARPHTVCAPGQWVKQPGSDSTDTECEDCPQNSYSDGLFTSCKPHTDCEARGLQEIRPGTSASDVECGEMSNPVVPIVTVLAIFIPISIRVVIFLVLKKKIPFLKGKVKQ